MNVFNIYGFIRLDSDIHIHEINSETIAAFTDHWYFRLSRSIVAVDSSSVLRQQLKITKKITKIFLRFKVV